MATSILVVGAGRSSSSLISYLIERGKEMNATITVGDISLAAAKQQSPGNAIHFDIENAESSRAAIRKADIVISMIPAFLHLRVAEICISEKKHLLTASYVSDAMMALDAKAKELGLLFLNECGLDPGIDHMSAMQVIDKIRAKGGEMLSFESFTGGLIAPETDPSNPWRYKFTWNPRNVVLAGQGTSRFFQNGNYKYIPYHQLFKRTTQVTIPGHGEFQGYANRDSLKYIVTYGLQSIKTMLRGTLRYNGYCSAWDVFVQLGCTDDSYQMEEVQNMTHASFLESFLEVTPGKNLVDSLCSMLGISPTGPEIKRLSWSGLFDQEKVGIAKGTPAQVLEHILNKKWKLDAHDQDFVAMWHRFVFKKDGKTNEIQASLAARGDDGVRTAMAKTVGLPLAIAAKLLIEGKIKQRGVVIPVTKEFYDPILGELKGMGIELNEVEF